MPHQKQRQCTDTVVMVRPDHFGFNPETAATNAFQHKPASEKTLQMRNQALTEFAAMVETLRSHDIEVLVLSSRTDRTTPDAVFPNNWFSHHAAGPVVLYPMLAPNRRVERQVESLINLLASVGVHPPVLDLTAGEQTGKFLEGTGSLVLDRVHHVAFAMKSPRTTEAAFTRWCAAMGYTGVFFHAYDKNRLPIYHTNVVMTIGDGFAVACPQSIPDAQERTVVMEALQQYQRKLIPITLKQIYAFCGNILHLTSKKGKRYIILSTSAYNAFTKQERQRLETYGHLVAVPIPTIETVGGGSARCMLAEIFPSGS